MFYEFGTYLIVLSYFKIIQPLLHCVPLYNLLTTVGDLIPHDLSKGKKGHTLLDSM